eukprot:gene5486-226_t
MEVEGSWWEGKHCLILTPYAPGKYPTKKTRTSMVYGAFRFEGMPFCGKGMCNEQDCATCELMVREGM